VAAPNNGSSGVFPTHVGVDLYMLKIECGPGDTTEPVLTIMLPEED